VNNTVNNKPLVYFEDKSDIVIQNAGQVILVNSSNITLEGFNLSNTSIGIELWNTSDCKIINNTASNNPYGIYLHSSSNNTLSGNTASNNNGGIYLYYSSNNNMLSGNTASNNYDGIELFSSCNNNTLIGNTASNNHFDGIKIIISSNNILYHNNLVNNTEYNARDYNGSNQWDSDSEGNYYSDYTGTDSDGDGIGDTPYPIPGGISEDRYPLMAPYSPPISDYEGKLLRQTGDLKVYLIENDKKRHFTSSEALEWNGYSFNNVIEVSEDVMNSFEPGLDINITQAIIDKYHALGGAATFGPPAGTGEQTGYPDSSSVVCSYVNFQNGAIEYFTNGDQAGNAYTILNPFFDKWASMGYAKSVLGYPISNMSDTQTSSFRTPFKYQNFMNGTEKGALEYNLTSGEVFEIHGAIYATWSAIGYANSILGLVTSDERDAVPSFKGTTGRVSDFENGHLHWHSSGDHYMVTYMTYGDLDELYVSMGGTASWLGFPVIHQEDRGGYGYCEFEGGYIEWDAASGKYVAQKYEITDGLVAEWHFDEGTGNVLGDSSGNGNDGTIYGATWTTNGKFDSALQFDGNDYIVIPDSPELSGGAGKNLTVEYWFNTNNQGAYIISKIRDVSYKDWSALLGGFGPGLNFWYENRGYDRRFYSGSTIEEGIWHHGAFTFQRSTSGSNAVLKMYLDGNELTLTPFYQDGVPSNQLYDMPDTSAPVSIGYAGTYYGNLYFNGKIDEIKIFDRVLSNDEIKAEYERGGSSSPTNKILFQSMQDGNEEIYLMDEDGSNQIRLTQNPASDGYPVCSPDNQKIAFVSNRNGDWEIFSMNTDGNLQTNLTRNPANDGYLSWSPDGQKIVFASDRDSLIPNLLDIYVMNADGTNVIRLTNNAAEDVHPAWSPDGQKIAFASDREGNREIYVMNTDGTNVINLTNYGAAYDDYPAWSPDNTKIAFASDRDSHDSEKLDIYLMNADGSNVIRLTSNSVDDRHPAWSLDGSKIAFVSDRDGNREIYVMKADGTDVIRLTNQLGDDQHPSFSPLTSEPTLPTINIISPNGGEIWQAGTTQTIQWSYTGDPYGVEIEIFNSSGPVQTFTYVPVGSDGSGTYQWDIPENLASGTDYQVKITIIGSAYSDTSGYFTISAPASGFTVGQGAPTPEIEQLFIDAYNRNGGVGVLGDPATEVHDAWGYLVQDFPGVPDIPGGVIMYNSIQGDAFYIHGAIWEKYYTLVDKSKLGPVASDEGEAAILPQGTTGRYTKFETGTIHWISDKDDENVGHSQRGESFVTYGELDALYTSMGGTYSDLGFPVMDQEERDGHGFCEFEGGSIAWDGNEYQFVSLSSSFLKPNYPSEVFTTGDLKYSILNTEGNGFTVKIYASVILPDNTIKYAYSDEWPLCFGTSTASLTCSLSPLLLSDVKRPLVEESILIEDGYSVWNANEMTGDEPPGLYTWKIWYEDINNPGKILASSTASYIVSYSRPEILRLSIQEETNNSFQVSVDGQEYTVATLNHYIDPYTLKISETNNEVKVYLDMDGNPVEDGEISRKIGVVDHINKLQKNGLKDQLYQKQETALIRMVYAGNLPFVDWVVDTTETIILLPTKVIKELFNSLIEECAAFVYDNIFNNQEELNDKAIENFLEANNNYFNAWNEIRNDADVLDYEKANVVLENYLIGDFNFGMGQYILDNYYVPKGNPLIFEIREAAKIASLGTTEEIIAAAISVEYVSVSYNKHGITQCDISKKPYEFTSYTLQLAQSSPISNEYENCILKINEETEQIKQDVSDIFTQQITLGILNSPGELRIYDSQNRVTGLIDGQIIEEIPNSAYISEDETVVIYDAIDTYRYEVEGTDFGTYGLDIISYNSWDDISAFNAFNIPTTPAQNHQYDINWEMLFNNQNGVSIQIDSDGDGVFEQTIITGNTFYIYNITFFPPITTMDQFNLKDGSTLPIKFTVNHHITNEFIYDPTVNVTITNSTGHLITYFTNGTGTESVRINSTEEQCIVNFQTKDYDLNMGETYAITVTFGELDSLRGYDITYFTLMEGGKVKGKSN